MRKNGVLLREKVYNYLREELAAGNLEPGCYINVGQLAESLRISKTPLRDALILLEADGVVTIYPRKGFMVNPVSVEMIRHIYQIGSGLESALLMSVFDYIAPIHLNRMREIVQKAQSDFTADDFSNAHRLNKAFHGVFHSLSDNAMLVRQLNGLYSRLYNFPARDFSSAEVKKDEWDYWNEHETIIDLIGHGSKKEVADFIRDVHWTLKERYTETLHVLLPSKGDF